MLNRTFVIWKTILHFQRFHYSKIKRRSTPVKIVAGVYILFWNHPPPPLSGKSFLFPACSTFCWLYFRFTHITAQTSKRTFLEIWPLIEQFGAWNGSKNIITLNFSSHCTITTIFPSNNATLSESFAYTWFHRST